MFLTIFDTLETAMATFNFYLKDSNSSIPTPLYLQITSNYAKAKWYFKQSILPKHWDKRKQRVKGLTIAPELNTLLDKYKTQAQVIANRLSIEKEVEPLPKEIKLVLKEYFFPKLKNEKAVVNDLLEFEKVYFPILKGRVNKTTKNKTTKGTLETYKQTFNLFKEFHALTGISLDFDNIDLEFYTKFVQFLEGTKNFKTNTVAKHITRLKTFLNEATELGYNTNTKYKGKYFTAQKETANNIFLDENELKIISEFDFSSKPYLERTRDVFVLGCYTGLRFSDYRNVPNADKQTISGTEYYSIIAQKTQKMVVVPILPEAKKIIDKYTDEGMLLLPKPISNQKFNEYLKEIGKEIKELHSSFKLVRTVGGKKTTTEKKKWELLTTHTARRSFATNMYLRKIPVPNIMAITGHKTEKSFYTYIQMTPMEHAVKFVEYFNQSNK